METSIAETIHNSERLTEHFVLNTKTQNEKIQAVIFIQIDLDFFHSPLLNTIDVNTWKVLLSRNIFFQDSWESWDDYLVAVLKWAVSNKNMVEKDQVKELFDLINMSEISETIVAQIGEWKQLDSVIDQMNLLKTLKAATRSKKLPETSKDFRKVDRILRYDNLDETWDLTDGWLDFSGNKTFAKIELVNIVKKTGFYFVTEVEVERNLEQNTAKIRTILKVRDKMESPQSKGEKFSGTASVCV